MPRLKLSSRTSRSGAITKTTSAKSKLRSRRSTSERQPEAAAGLTGWEAIKKGEVNTAKRQTKFLRARTTQQKMKRNTSSNSMRPHPAPLREVKVENSATPKKSPKNEAEEKRLRKYRSKPPSSFLVKLGRAETQRMIVLGRTRDEVNAEPRERIDIVGSTGNIYTVTIDHEPSCTCPDSMKGNECKHKVYALHTILKAPYHLQYQLAFLTSELEQIFAHAPLILTDVGEDSKGRRKPTDGECPICYMELDEKNNELVWCKSQCGHNMHRSCFNQWAGSQQGKEVRCVYCRTPWEMDAQDPEAVKAAGEYGEDGYINVASQFGMSRARDYSGYYQPWARRQFGHGW